MSRAGARRPEDREAESPVSDRTLLLTLTTTAPLSVLLVLVILVFGLPYDGWAGLFAVLFGGVALSCVYLFVGFRVIDRL